MFSQRVGQSLAAIPIPSNARMLVAISGGSDSVCLAYVLKDLGYEIAFAHVNFQLRGEESEGEHRFIADLAEKWNVTLFDKRFETKHLVAESADSLQMVARKLRYDFFEEVLQKGNFDYCATAHHANDNAETLLFNLIKGSPNQVMKGIPMRREKYIRPLLFISKKEIFAYLQENNIAYKNDSSNLKNDYQRNQIRNQIIPQIQAINPSFAENLVEKYHFYQSQNAFIQQVINPFLPEGKELPFSDFSTKFGNDFLDLFLLAFLKKHHITGKKALEICALKGKEVGKKVEIEGDYVVRTREGISIIKTQESLFFQINSLTQNSKFELENWQIEIEFPLQNNHNQVFTPQKNIFYLDFDKLHFPLIFRSPKQGDRMQPLGMKGKKLISDIMIDNKFTAQQKSQAFVIEDAHQILALSDFRIADSVKIEAETKQILVIRLKME